jgi:hypothetical protein
LATHKNAYAHQAARGTSLALFVQRYDGNRHTIELLDRRLSLVNKRIWPKLLIWSLFLAPQTQECLCMDVEGQTLSALPAQEFFAYHA